MSTVCALVTSEHPHIYSLHADYDGEYVLYYSVSTIGSQNSAIGVSTSASMDPGTWTDHGEVISSVAGDVYNASQSHYFDSPTRTE